jgi:hypothetical protein
MVEDVRLSAKKWYRIRVRVLGARIQAWLDDRQIVDFDAHGRTISVGKDRGVGAFAMQKGPHTEALIRNIRLRRLKPDAEQAP